MNHEICVRMEINNKQVAFVTFIDFLSLTELTLHLEKNKGLEGKRELISFFFVHPQKNVPNHYTEHFLLKKIAIWHIIWRMEQK